MSKQSRGKSWLDFRLADDFDAGSGPCTVELVARRGTGVQGFRVSVVFMPHDGSAELEVELPPAGSTADVHRVVRELTGDVARLTHLHHDALGKAHSA